MMKLLTMVCKEDANEYDMKRNCPIDKKASSITAHIITLGSL